jgi:flavin-dependent dehydrogenase
MKIRCCGGLISPSSLERKIENGQEFKEVDGPKVAFPEMETHFNVNPCRGACNRSMYVLLREKQKHVYIIL